MTATVKVQRKGQITIPVRLRIQVGLDDGDLVEARAEKGRIVLTPKSLSDRADDDEYTPSQRKDLDARLTESLGQAKRGETYGPFETHQALTDFLHRQLRETRSKKIKSAKARAR